MGKKNRLSLFSLKFIYFQPSTFLVPTNNFVHAFLHAFKWPVCSTYMTEQFKLWRYDKEPAEQLSLLVGCLAVRVGLQSELSLSVALGLRVGLLCCALLLWKPGGRAMPWPGWLCPLLIVLRAWYSPRTATLLWALEDVLLGFQLAACLSQSLNRTLCISLSRLPPILYIPPASSPSPPLLQPPTPPSNFICPSVSSEWKKHLFR